MNHPELLDADRLPRGRLAVAVSGGLDSMVLLHHLRFPSGRGGDLVAAHLDHAMRPGSAADARWLTGVCRAWQVPLRVRRLPTPPSGEEAARECRYAFLREVARSTGAAVVLTAHHADDQAETVLFRVLRGTGVEGLRGMERERRGVVRPLLARWRSDLRGYAARHGVPYREDPTNDDVALARNALRHVVLPAAEAGVAPASRRALVRLSENAARHREELAALEDWVFRDAVEAGGGGRQEVRVEFLASLPVPLRRRLVRTAARRAGATLSQRGTDLALEAVENLQSGRGLDLTGGIRLERTRDRWIFHPPVRARGNPREGSDSAPGGEKRHPGRETVTRE